MSSIPMVFGTSKGIAFEWGDVSFTMPLAKANELVDLIEVMQSCGEETSDDLMTDLWVGKKMMRYAGHRIPIEIDWLYPNLLTALDRHQERQHDKDSYEDVQDAMKDIIKDLGFAEESDKG
jgi:formiminotetrahydrofolate cyclodeaminase